MNEVWFEAFIGALLDGRSAVLALPASAALSASCCLSLLPGNSGTPLGAGSSCEALKVAPSPQEAEGLLAARPGPPSERWRRRQPGARQSSSDWPTHDEHRSCGMY